MRWHDAARSCVFVTLLGACSQPAAPPEPAVVAMTPRGEALKADARSPQDSAATSESAASGSAPKTTRESPPRFERMVLLAPRGPLIVHIEISIGGEPQLAVVKRLLEGAARAAGANDANDPDWAQLLANEQFTGGQWGNAPLKGAGDAQRIIRQFDVNRDGRAQSGELAAFLAQENASGHPFSVQSVSPAGDEQRRDSSLFALLDQDQDGRLSAVEMATAAVRLRSRDADDDEMVVPADFRDSPTAQQNIQSVRPPDRAFELTKWELDSIHYALGEMYGGRRGLDASSFALVPGLLAELDADANGVVDQREMAGLVEARADLVLKVDFGPTSNECPRPSIAVVKTSDDLAAAGAEVRPSSGRVELALDGCCIEIMVVDAAAGSDPSRTSSDDMATPHRYGDFQVQVRVGEAEDPLFAWLDANHDGRLTLREMHSAAARLAELDRDGDAVVNSAEMPAGLVCAILRGAPAGEMMPVMPAARPSTSASEAPAWFAAMDQNADGEISPREFLGTAQQFADLDANHDGFVDAAEADGAKPADP